jgi:hypothetical protein
MDDGCGVGKNIREGGKKMENETWCVTNVS